MKPITFAAATQPYLTDKLFLLDPVLASIRYIERIIRNRGRISSKGGSTLPPELWLMIIKHLDDEARQPSGKRQMHLVKASLAPSLRSAGGPSNLLRCVRVEFNLPPGQGLAGSLYNRGSVFDFLDFLAEATADKARAINEASHAARQDLKDGVRDMVIHEAMLREESAEGILEEDDSGVGLEDMIEATYLASVVEIPTLRELSGAGATFFLSLRLSDDAGYPPGLYDDIEIPDILAWTEGGSCSVCSGERVMLAQGDDSEDVIMRFWGDHPLMGSGMRFACPLCVGVFNQQDWDTAGLLFFGATLFDGYFAPNTHKAQAIVEGRLKQLGYSTSAVDDDA
ncbi:hypothetical protein B0T16DRAFT_490361 [Cercophora newfieldiana]|uniref:Uncharacterized protein n=1 Tax=Cercophora newfieldiana TaxID=92897 RepID=A0AA40CX83_9PEZI|nr:hypothetical protein B0T16DRAFT_490361 [Cercophora newfieldiana]